MNENTHLPAITLFLFVTPLLLLVITLRAAVLLAALVVIILAGALIAPAFAIRGEPRVLVILASIPIVLLLVTVLIGLLAIELQREEGTRLTLLARFVLFTPEQQALLAGKPVEVQADTQSAKGGLRLRNRGWCSKSADSEKEGDGSEPHDAGWCQSDVLNEEWKTGGLRGAGTRMGDGNLLE